MFQPQGMPYNGTSLKGWLVSAHDNPQVQQVHHIFMCKLTEFFTLGPILCPVLVIGLDTRLKYVQRSAKLASPIYTRSFVLGPTAKPLV
jgi:hypothetical protein